MRKEAVLAVKSLLSVLLREHSLRSGSTFRDIVLRETETWLALLSTVEGFLKDNDLLGTITRRGVDAQRLEHHLTNTRTWITHWQTLAKQNQLTEQEYQRFVRYTDMILTKTSDTLDNILKQEPVYRTQPQNWLRNAAAGLLITICGYTGIGMNTYAAENETPVAMATTATKETKKEQKDYVAEFMKEVEAVKIPEGKNAAWYNNTGYDLMKKGQFSEALKYFQESIRLNAVDSSPYTNIATTFTMKAEKSSLVDEKTAFMKRSLSAYELSFSVISKQEMSDSDRMQLCRLNLSARGRIAAALGERDLAKSYLQEATKYGALSEKTAQLLKSLSN